jgi:fructokinase
MRKVITLGESIIDFVSTRAGRLETAAGFEMAAGGAPANVAACVARLGGESAFVGMRGTDPFGVFLNNVLADAGVDTRFFSTTEGAKTGLAFVSIDNDGDRHFEFYRDPGADTRLSSADVPMHMLSGNILHVGSVSLSTGPARAATLSAVQHAHANAGFVSFDPNWRPALWTDVSDGLHMIKEVFPYTDVIKVNREELELLTGSSDPEHGAGYFHQAGISTVLITLDKDGCFYSCDGRGHDIYGQQTFSGAVPGRSVTAVDTTGAGDAFIGSFLYKLSQVSSLRQVSAQTLQDWIEFAVAVSALVTTRRGAIPAMPTREQVEEFVSSR